MSSATKPTKPKQRKSRKKKNGLNNIEGGGNSQIARKRRENNAFTQELATLLTNCSICLDKICYGPSFSLPCGHAFGEVCIDAWICLHKRCPTCYAKVDYDSVFLTVHRNSHPRQIYLKAILNAKTKIGFSGVMAGSFVAGGEAAAGMLEGAALVASQMITIGATNGMEKNCRERDSIQPRMEPEDVEMLKKRIETAKFVAGATATVTGCVANVVGTGLWALGSLMAPLIKRGSKKILKEFEVEDQKADDVVEGAIELAKGALLSTGKILRGFEHATTVVASSAASNAARMYEFSRGLRPGELESDVENITRNVVQTAFNVRALPPKTICTISRSVQPPHKPSTAVMRYGKF